MTLYTTNLYERLIETNAPHFCELRVMSGYGSPTFFEKIATRYKNLKIKIYIGMTFQGISKKSHKFYIKLMRENPNIEVFYQIKGIQSHIKLIEFKKKNLRKAYMGSANFTENGFINQRELMTEVNDETDTLFNSQEIVSLKANSTSIHNYITFFDEESQLEHNEECNIESVNDNYSENTIENVNTPKKINQNKNEKLVNKNKLMDFRSETNYLFYKKFDIEIVLDEKKNPRCLDSGINSWINGKDPVLTQTPKLSFAKLFPIEKTFEILTVEGEKYKAKLTGKFNGDLKLLDANFYDYIKKLIGLKERRAISRQDLLDFGCTKLSFERLDEFKYIMTFGLND